MINCDCGSCRHISICRYVEQYAALVEEIKKLRKEETNEIFSLQVRCKHHDMKQTMNGVLHRDGRGA